MDPYTAVVFVAIAGFVLLGVITVIQRNPTASVDISHGKTKIKVNVPQSSGDPDTE